MSSPLTTPTVPVEVTAAEGQRTLHVHQAILRQIPFFNVQQERWAKRGLSVKLPHGASLDSLTVVLEKIYFPKKSVLDVDTSQALRLIQVASMLNCDAALLDDLVVALRSTLKSEADAEMLRAFCEEHEAPPELVQLATRLKNPRDTPKDFDSEEVRILFRTALCQGNDEQLKLAKAHMKKRSRCGGDDVWKVAEIIATEAAQRCNKLQSYAVAVEFSTKYPATYAFMVKTLFAKGTKRDYDEGAKSAVDFVELGTTGVTTGSMDAEDLVALYRLLSEPTVTPNGYGFRPLLVHTALRSVLAGSLRRVNCQLQVKLCEVFCGMPDGSFARFDHAGPLASLAVEAKALFADRVVGLPDDRLKEVITKSVLESLGDKAKRLCFKMASLPTALPEIPGLGSHAGRI